MDEKHAGHSARDAESADAIYRIYRNLDRIAGKALDSMGGDSTLLIISDHGFAPFHTAFHLNSWLESNDFLRLLDERKRGKSEYLDNIDWAQTSAYAIGFNALYINTAGRESRGIVPDGAEKAALIQKLRRELLDAVDPATGAHPVSEVYVASDTYRGAHTKDAPDMIVGYSRGYQASWETAFGMVPDGIYVTQKDKWSGAHAIDPRLVPGVVLSNRKITAESPDMLDIPATILSEFGIPVPTNMEGKSIF